MKRILALLLTLLLSCSCLSALAVSDQCTITAGITLHNDALFTMGAVEPSEENFANMDMLVSLINAIGAKTTITQEGVEFSFLLKNTPVMTAGLYVSETALTILSDMFPHYAIQLDLAGLEALLNDEVVQQLLSSSISGQDSEAMLSSLPTLLTALSEKVALRAVSEEGAYTISGVTFDKKVTFDTLAIANLLIDAVEVMLDNELFYNQLISQGTFEDKADALAQLNEARAQFSTPEEASNFVGLEMANFVLYQKANGADLSFILSTKASYGDSSYLVGNYIGGKLNLQLLSSAGDFTSPASIARAAKLGVAQNDLVDMSLSCNAESKDFTLVVDTHINESYSDPVSLCITTKGGTLPLSGYALEAAYALSATADPLVKLNLVYMPTGKLILKDSLTPENIIKVDIMALIEEDPDALAALEEEFQKLLEDVTAFGSVSLMSNALNAMPNEIGELITLLLQSNLI